MRIEVSYQSDLAQEQFNEAFPDVVYCFDGKRHKVAEMLKAARKFGNGILFVVNGNDVIEDYLF